MIWKSCVFIDKADFNMYICRNFGKSKKGMSVKSVVPSNSGITLTIIGAICEMGVAELSLHKPKAVHRKGSRLKKKSKREDGKAEEVEVNARVGTRSEHFLDFLSSLIDTLDQCSMKGHHLVMNNAIVYKMSEV